MIIVNRLVVMQDTDYTVDDYDSGCFGYLNSDHNDANEVGRDAVDEMISDALNYLVEQKFDTGYCCLDEVIICEHEDHDDDNPEDCPHCDAWGEIENPYSGDTVRDRADVYCEHEDKLPLDKRVAIGESGPIQVFIDKEHYLKLVGRTQADDTWFADAEKAAESHAQYLRHIHDGEVWGFVWEQRILERGGDGDLNVSTEAMFDYSYEAELESCWGFVGEDYALDQMIDHIGLDPRDQPDWEIVVEYTGGFSHPIQDVNMVAA